MQVKFHTKRLSISFPKPERLKALGERAFDAIKARFQKGKLADGKPAPTLKNRKSWFVSSEDTRWTSGGTLRRWVYRKAKRVGQIRMFADYAEAKRALGAKTQADGELTGEMWRGAAVSAISTATGAVLRLYFTGTQKIGGTHTTETGQVRANSIANKDKARALQKRMPDGSKAVTPQFGLLELTPEEFAELRDGYAEGVTIAIGNGR